MPTGSKTGLRIVAGTSMVLVAAAGAAYGFAAVLDWVTYAMTGGKNQPPVPPEMAYSLTELRRNAQVETAMAVFATALFVVLYRWHRGLRRSAARLSSSPSNPSLERP